MNGTRREPAIIVGNILSAKFILLILYGRKVYQISTSRQESRNLAVLSQFTRRRPKTLQPTLQGFATTRSLTAMYATDLDGNTIFISLSLLTKALN